MLIEMKLMKGQVLINEGDASDCIYILKSGELGIYKYDFKLKKHQLISQVLPGEMVGEMSFLDNSPRSASVKAHADCVISILNRPAFDTIISTQHPLIQQLLKTLSLRLRKSNEKINE
jgi:CRP-like cAMP-binding protein